MDFDKYFEELNEMANFKNFGESNEEEMTIDGINVTECGYFCESDNECSICGMGTDGEDTFCKNCKDNSNCYYKQLKRLEFELKVTKADYEASEQENTQKQEMIDRQWKLLEQCGVSAGGELKRVSYLLENLRKENAELKAELQKFKDMAKKGLDEFKDVGGCWGCGLQLQLNQDIEDIKQLKAENERLDQESQELFNDKLKLDDLVKELRQENERLKEEIKMDGEYLDKKLEQYRKTLQEIKAIATRAFTVCDDDCGNANRFTDILDLITKAKGEE